MRGVRERVLEGWQREGVSRGVNRDIRKGVSRRVRGCVRRYLNSIFWVLSTAMCI